MPCSRAAPMSCRDPDRAGRGPDQPSGRVGDDPHAHPVSFVFSRVVRPVPTAGHAHSLDTRQRAVENREHLAPNNLDGLLEARGHHGEYLGCFADIAKRRGRADPEPAGEIGIGLTLAQVRDEQLRRRPNIQATPPGAQLGAAVAQCISAHDQRMVGHGHPRGAKRHPQLPARRVDPANRSSTRSFIHVHSPRRGTPRGLVALAVEVDVVLQ